MKKTLGVIAATLMSTPVMAIPLPVDKPCAGMDCHYEESTSFEYQGYVHREWHEEITRVWVETHVNRPTPRPPRRQSCLQPLAWAEIVADPPTDFTVSYEPGGGISLFYQGEYLRQCGNRRRPYGGGWVSTTTGYWQLETSGWWEEEWGGSWAMQTWKDWHCTPGKGDTTPDPVPEPATMLLVGMGVIGMAGVQLRRSK